MKIEVGKFYKSRGGHKVRIYAIDSGGNFPIHGAFLINEIWKPIALTKEGGFNISYENPSQYDIISEWQEPLDFDWDCLPKWADKWIAKNEIGTWYCFNKKPAMISELMLMQILPIGMVSSKIPESHRPEKITGNWKDSLFKNPKYED